MLLKNIAPSSVVDCFFLLECLSGEGLGSPNIYYNKEGLRNEYFRAISDVVR